MSTDKRNRSEDRRLSEIYKALAGERVPDSLNDRVLQMAADSRRSYARARVWMRPLALAATIGLCLAIVLEITRVPQVVPDFTSFPDPGRKAVGESQRRLDEDGTTGARSIAPGSAAPAKADNDRALHRPAAASQDNDDRVRKEAFLPREMPAPQAAEDLARARSGADPGLLERGSEPGLPLADPGPGREPSAKIEVAEPVDNHRITADGAALAGRAAVASFEAGSAAAKRLPEASCPETARAAAESWLACIRKLREDGQEQEADLEYEQFLGVFPDDAGQRTRK